MFKNKIRPNIEKTHLVTFKKKSHVTTTNPEFALFCPDPECTLVFSSMTQLDDHLLAGEHKHVVQTSSDMAIISFAKRLKATEN